MHRTRATPAVVAPPARGFVIRLTVAAMLAAASAFAAGARNLVAPPASNDAPAPWSYWSPRPQLAQEHAVVTRDGAAALRLHSPAYESYGFWSTRINGIEPGKFYAFEALHQAEGLAADTGSVFAVISWYASDIEAGTLQRDYIDRRELAGGWVRAARTLQAPAKAASARIELGLKLAAGATVWWRDVRFSEVPAPPPRAVRIATTHLVPASPPTIDGNTRLLADMLDRVGPEHPDVVLLSENFATRSVKGTLEQRAQTIPGPLTEMLSAKARTFHTHIITTLLERDGKLFHNTAVIIDRAGRLLGKYRKVHLTIGELESGLTPGREYPVFDTDIGRIGVVTCWDNWFSEPMRILRLRGAEIVFMPVAGDGAAKHWDAVWSARAMDNGVYLATASTVGESPSRIIAPTGEVIAETNDRFSYGIANIDLNREWRLRYLSVSKGEGEARSLYLRERRPETYGPLLKDSEPQPAAALAAPPAS